VGSVNSPTTATLQQTQIAQVNGDELVTLSEKLKKVTEAPAAAVQIDVSVATGEGENPWEARQLALLRALRMRASLIAQGVGKEKISIEIDSKKIGPDAVSVSVIQGSLQ